MLLAAGILTALTVDVDGYTLFRLIYAIPDLALRAVCRVILVTMFPGGPFSGCLSTI